MGGLQTFRLDMLNGRIAPIAAVRTSGTVSPKRSFAVAAANDRVGWNPDLHAAIYCLSHIQHLDEAATPRNTIGSALNPTLNRDAAAISV
jgi:hypothetical protein